MISAERLAAVAQNRNPEYLRKQVIDLANAGGSYLAIATATGLTKGVVAGLVYRARKQGLVTLEVQRAPRHTGASIAKPEPARMPRPAGGSIPAWEPARVSHADLRSHHCQWPLWSSPGPKFFCGNEQVPGRPYCAACNVRSMPAVSSDVRAAA